MRCIAAIWSPCAVAGGLFVNIDSAVVQECDEKKSISCVAIIMVSSLIVKHPSKMAVAVLFENPYQLYNAYGIPWHGKCTCIMWRASGGKNHYISYTHINTRTQITFWAYLQSKRCCENELICTNCVVWMVCMVNSLCTSRVWFSECVCVQNTPCRHSSSSLPPTRSHLILWLTDWLGWLAHHRCSQCTYTGTLAHRHPEHPEHRTTTKSQFIPLGFGSHSSIFENKCVWLKFVLIYARQTRQLIWYSD